ncbi:MAG TPA: hypothetical protein VHE35_05560 [Kofleriaceae bacterium]|nr:hypothetical protein [Kofleriaceae bacterium]
MRSLLVALTLALALVACGKNKSESTTPKGPSAHGPITEDNLKAYFGSRFPNQVADGTLALNFAEESVAPTVIEELSILGITDMSGVAAMVPADFETKGFGAIKTSSDPTENLAGLMRDLMLIHDTRGYVEKAWRKNWSCSGPQDFPAPIAYGMDFSILQNAGMCDSEGGDDGNVNPCSGGDDGDDDGDDDGGDDDDDGNPCGD